MPKLITQAGRTVALCYLRKSIVRNGLDYASIDMQRAGVASFCAARGWQCEWYEDAEGHSSGRHEQGRPNWLRLKRRVDDPDVAAVVSYKLDRLGRSVRDIATFIQYCSAHSVGVLTADGQIDTTNRLNALTSAQLNILATFAQFESDIASDRMRERVAVKDAAGVNHGKPPFGMVRIGEGSAARFIASADIGAVIRCLELYAGGMSYDQCAARLNRDAVPFKDRAGLPCEWGRESVRTVVGNVLRYAGFHVPQTGYDAKANKISLADGEGDLCDRWARAIGAWRSPAVDAVIDRQLANAVIDRRNKNQNTGRPASAAIYLLTPITYWRGRRLRGQSLPVGRVYRTYGSGASFGADDVEATFLHHMTGLHMTDEIRAGVRQVLISRMSEARIEMLQAKITEAKQTRSLLLDLLLSRAIDRDDYNTRFAQCERIINDCEMEMRAPAEVEAAMTRLSEFGAMVATMPAHHQKRIIHSIFAQIGLNDDGEVAAVQWKPWAQQIWGSLRPDSQSLQTLPKVGVEDNVCIFPALPEPVQFWAELPAMDAE